jgi:hypothetical protein
MITHTIRLLGLVLIAGLLATTAERVQAAPADDALLPVDQHTSDKARQLASKHARALRDLSAGIYHCLPWLDVQKQSIGFFRPKGATQDDRYLAMRVYIEQNPSTQFSGLSVEERASAMFSRYVGAMLRRMTERLGLVTDSLVDGFSVIVSWLKPTSDAGTQPVHETIAVFAERPTVAEYVAGRVSIAALAERAMVFGFDGETPLGRIRIRAWEDDFLKTFPIANDRPAPGVTCR